jgi:hypothetical protein
VFTPLATVWPRRGGVVFIVLSFVIFVVVVVEPQASTV